MTLYRCTILENSTMSEASLCEQINSTKLQETQCLFCCSNENNCNENMIGSDEWPQPDIVAITTAAPVTVLPIPFDLIPVIAGGGGAALILILIIVLICIFVVRARNRRKNLALLVEQLERFKARQANRSFMDKGMATLNRTLGFATTSRPMPDSMKKHAGK